VPINAAANIIRDAVHLAEFRRDAAADLDEYLARAAIARLIRAESSYCIDLAD
jgi:hypothetical protein